MKKILALILAGMMAISAGAAVYAEEATEAAEPEVIEFDYQDVDQELYEGTWINTGLGFDMYLPSEWTLLEVDEESDVVFQAAESEEGGRNVAVTYTEEGGVESTEDLYAQLEAGGYTGLQYVDMSGILGVGFDSDEKKVSGVAFIDTDGALYTVVLGPTDDEEFQAIALNIFMSISPTEEAETETEA